MQPQTQQQLLLPVQPEVPPGPPWVRARDPPLISSTSGKLNFCTVALTWNPSFGSCL